MNATRANAAAGTIAKAVQNVASTATTSVAHKVEPQPLPVSVPATVLYASRASAEPFTVEIAGTVFTPATDQIEARRAARLEQIGRELDIVAGAAGAPLLRELEQLWSERVNDVHDYVLRQVGYALSEAGHHDLWRVLYAQLGAADNKLRPNAADEFLHGDHVDVSRGSGW